MVTDQQIIPEESERLQALLDAGKAFSLIVTVPAADNILSNSVTIGVLKLDSGSAPADLLLDILLKEKGDAVAVVGKSDAVTAATIKAVFRQLGDNTTTTTILFAGKPKYVKELKEAAEKAEASFEGVVFPDEKEKAEESAEAKAEENAEGTVEENPEENAEEKVGA